MKNANDETNSEGPTFKEKMEAIDKEIEVSNRIGLDDLLEAPYYIRKFLSEDAPKQANKAFKALKHGITPGFIRRMNRKKVHAKYVEEREQ